MSDSTPNAPVAPATPELHQSFLMVGSGLKVQIVRVPAGTPGSDHYTPIRAKCLAEVHSAHDAVLEVVRAWNDLRKADVPNRPIQGK